MGFLFWVLVWSVVSDFQTYLGFFFPNQIVQLGFFFRLLMFPSSYSLPYLFGVFVFIGFSSELAVDFDENDLSFFEFSLFQKSDSPVEFLYFDS